MRRRPVLLLTLGTIFLALTAGVALAANMITGTNGDDELYGTPVEDVIDGLRGDDEIHGDAGNDRIYGGNGADTIDCGDGHDIVYKDKYDAVDANCEDQRLSKK